LDTDGNFVILDITIQDYRLTLVTIYGPNNPDFFQSLQSKICLYENTSVIVVGDWNVVQNYDKDTFNYQSENKQHCYPSASAGITTKYTNISPLPKPMTFIF
jgi:exonuclease III